MNLYYTRRIVEDISTGEKIYLEGDTFWASSLEEARRKCPEGYEVRGVQIMTLEDEDIIYNDRKITK